MSAAPKPKFEHPVARGTVKNENLNRPYQDYNEPATPQPVANNSTHPVRKNDDYGYGATSVAAVRGSMKRVMVTPFGLTFGMRDRCSPLNK